MFVKNLLNGKYVVIENGFFIAVFDCLKEAVEYIKDNM